MGSQRLLDLAFVLPPPEYLACAGGALLVVAIGFKLGSIEN
jgi:hypothetical protein